MARGAGLPGGSLSARCRAILNKTQNTTQRKPRVSFVSFEYSPTVIFHKFLVNASPRAAGRPAFRWRRAERRAVRKFSARDALRKRGFRLARRARFGWSDRFPA